MIGRLPVAVVIAGTLLLSACGSGSDRAGSDGVGTAREAGRTPTPRAGLSAAQAGVRAEIARLEWPAAYTPTVESLTPKLGDPKQLALTSENGKDLANIWNLCAWLDEAADRIEAGADPAQLDDAADHVTAWASDASGTLQVDYLVEGIRTGDPTGANQFIEANTCRPFPT